MQKSLRYLGIFYLYLWFDGNRATQTQYEALAWDGLEFFDRYSSTMPNSLGYSDDYMNENREKISLNIKQARQNENPCR